MWEKKKKTCGKRRRKRVGKEEENVWKKKKTCGKRRRKRVEEEENVWEKKKKTCGKREKTVGKEENRGKNKEIRVKAQEIRVKAQEVCGVLGGSCGVSVSVRRVCSSPHITADARFLYLFLGHNFDHDTPTHCTYQKTSRKRRRRSWKT